MKPFLLALDQGTTSSRAVLFDQKATAIAMAQEEFPQHFPASGEVEHDPADIWQSQARTAEAVLIKAGATVSQVAAIGISNQRETTLVWERATGKPIHRAIVWQDRRTAGICREWEAAGLGARVAERTGLRLDPYFSASKIRWILDHTPDGTRRAADGELCFGTVDSWLIWNLTGAKAHLTDVTNASRTLLMNLATCEWDTDLLEAFGIPSAMLPQIVASSGVCATGARDSFAAGIPIAGIAGDQQAALFGQACFQPGMAKNTYGTGCFLLAHTGHTPAPSRNGLLTTVACRLGVEPPEYALEGSVFMAGAVIQWLRDGLKIATTATEVAALAGTVADSGGLVLVPAFTGLGAPHWDPDARGLLIGLTRGTTPAHIARAALESIALQSADLLTCMERDSGIPLAELRVDGGASRSDLLMQIQADLICTDVTRPAFTETSALGAAFLAGLAVGFWKDRDALTALWKEDRRFHPQASAAWRDATTGDWNRAVQRCKGWSKSETES